MTQILRQLDSEWARLGNSRGARVALASWAGGHPALDGYADFDGVLQGRRDPAKAGPILAALARLAPTDDLAARVLLQALLPGLVRLSIVAANDDPAALDEMISLAWERIRTYPPQRTGSVAGNVLLDVRKRYRKHRQIEAPKDLVELKGEPSDERGSPEDEVLSRSLIDELTAAQRAGLMSETVLATIIRTRVWGENLADIAAEQGVTPQLLCHRRWRAEVRLRQLPLAA